MQEKLDDSSGRSASARTNQGKATVSRIAQPGTKVQCQLSREYLDEPILNSSKSGIPEIDQTTDLARKPEKSAPFAENSSACRIQEHDYITRANAMWNTSSLTKPATSCRA